MSIEANPAGGGIELSRRANTAVLLAGMLLYVGVVGFFATTMGRPQISTESLGPEFVLSKEALHAPENALTVGRVEVVTGNRATAQTSKDEAL